MHRIPAGLPLDPWVTNSLMHKAIRRGEIEIAQWAALRFHRQRGNAIWRRLAIIAFEDIGLGDIVLVQKVAAMSSDRQLRDVLGSDRDIIPGLVAEMALAPKDRSADYLICPAMRDPDLEQERVRIAGMSAPGRISVAVDATQPIYTRAVAALYAGGFNGYGRAACAQGDVSSLIEGFQHTGLPAGLAAATIVASRVTREPIALMLPILWTALHVTREQPSVADTTPPPARFCQGVPLYALDKHTSSGKRALGIFTTQNQRVGDTIAKYVPDFRARDVAAMAAYYTDAAPVSRHVVWSQSANLEDFAFHSDMIFAGCPREGVSPIIQAVRDELDHLNDIRFKLLDKMIAPRQGNLPLNEGA